MCGCTKNKKKITPVQIPVPEFQEVSSQQVANQQVQQQNIQQKQQKAILPNKRLMYRKHG